MLANVRLAVRADMKLISYNIQYGFGLDGSYDLSRAGSVIADADVIALQEVDRHWSRTQFEDQPARLATLLPQHYLAYAPGFDMDASLVRTDGSVENRRRQFGPMILSKFPIVWSRMHLLPLARMVRPINTQTVALETMIRTPAGAVRFWSVHLAHVGTEERLHQLDYMLALNLASPRTGGPWSGADDEPHRNWTEGEAEPEVPLASIIMGDFNSIPTGPEYMRMVGTQPFHRGVLYSDLFVDAAVAAGHHATDFYSHERVVNGVVDRRRLDYCFVSGSLAPRVRSYAVDVTERASDHFPVMVDIDLETLPDGNRPL
jgi:endonuclease/exonuclease/phosphatase family metal-dependent hydrolase